MRFKIDENLPAEAAGLLIDAGREAVTVGDEGLGGASDAVIFERCVQGERALITADLDFADIRAYPPQDSPGAIVLRLEHQDRQSVLAALRRSLPLLGREPLVGRLWVVEEGPVRIRGED